MRIIFFGTPEFAQVSLATLLANENFEVGLVVSQPDKPAGRGGKITSSPVALLAKENKIPLLQPARIKKNEADFINSVKTHGDFDLGVVIAFGQILPQSVLDLPQSGCVNVHGSLLPRWRGAAPIQRAILAGDKETGICLMKMDAGLDTGPVYSQEKITITPEKNFACIHDELASLGAMMLVRDLEKIVSGELLSIPQSSEEILYAEKILPEDFLISWKDSAQNILRKIQAFSPRPAAYTFYQGKRFKILKASLVSGKLAGKPGEIHVTNNSALEVFSGAGILSLEEVQLEGRNKMNIAEFLRGYPINKETTLG